MSRQPRGNLARLCIGAGPELLSRADLGASIAVMGVCLTAIGRDSLSFEADLSLETLAKTTLGSLLPGTGLNLEPSLLAGDPMDGHVVSGHVDGVGTLLERTDSEGLWRFSYPPTLAPMLAHKGSVAIDGISLTIADIDGHSLAVSLIPQTVASTCLKNLASGTEVNIEADPIGRYVARSLALQRSERKLSDFAEKGWGELRT